MSEEPENPQAFPNPINDVGDISYPGMTLRDYFAAKAMQGFSVTNWHVAMDYAAIAESAYMIADAMLAQRSKEG